jgi:hypothetical protein
MWEPRVGEVVNVCADSGLNTWVKGTFIAEIKGANEKHYLCVRHDGVKGSGPNGEWRVAYNEMRRIESPTAFMLCGNCKLFAEANMIGICSVSKDIVTYCGIPHYPVRYRHNTCNVKTIKTTETYAYEAK